MVEPLALPYKSIVGGPDWNLRPVNLAISWNIGNMVFNVCLTPIRVTMDSLGLWLEWSPILIFGCLV